MPPERVGMLPGAGPPPPPTIVGVDVGGTVVGVRVDVLVGVLVGEPVGVFVGVFVAVAVGGPATTRQLDTTVFRTLATAERLAAVLVKAAGSPVQSAFNCPAAFVTLTVTVQDEAPAGTCRLLTAIVLAPAVAVVAAARDPLNRFAAPLDIGNSRPDDR